MPPKAHHLLRTASSHSWRYPDFADSTLGKNISVRKLLIFKPAFFEKGQKWL
jgi:hypothetical protein